MTEQNLPERTNPETRAVAQRQKTIKELLLGDAMREQFAKALPSLLPPDRFIRVALTAMNKTPKLTKCTHESFFNSLLTLAQLGIEPDGRRAHLIPYENRKAGTVECQLIVDYKGIVELIMRTGLAARIHADVVCENDVFEYDMGAVTKHKIDFRKPRGEMYAAWAMVEMRDGSRAVAVMSREEIEKIRSRSRAGQNGPWVTDYNEMAKKTVFRRLSKMVPWAAEIRDAIEADDDAIDTTATVREPAATLDDLADQIMGDGDDDATNATE